MSDDRDDECGKVHPNLRDICRCERAGMTLDQCNRRRLGWNCAPLLAMPGELVPDEAEHKPMTAVEKIASFVSVTAQTVWRNVVYGEKMLTAEEMQPRLDICNACPSLIDGHCNHCGCQCLRENKVKWLNKLAHRTAECPIGKWGPVTQTTESA